jgi:hypothetical protein
VLTAAGNIQAGAVTRIESTQVLKILSTNAVNNVDTRLSLDVVATFPNSAKITVVSGKETREYVLGRFILNDYKRFETVTSFDDDGLTGVTKIREHTVVGLEDLTRGDPDVSSNFLLPGSIQLIKLRLETRFYEDSQIVTKPTLLDGGFWTIKLLFSKKV